MKRQKFTRLIVVSYFSGFAARVTSEWVEDRLRVAERFGLPVVLITSPQSRLKSQPGLTVVRVPSLSFHDFKFEISEMNSNRGGLGLDLVWILPWMLISITFGVAFDIVFKAIAGQRSTGMYSWSIPVTIVGSLVALLWRGGRIYGTGGPSSAQVAATVMGKMTGRQVYLEFQDPFIGSEMHVSSAASRILKFLELFFVKNADQITLVSIKAGDDLRKRHPLEAMKIRAEHPGSWNFGLGRQATAKESNNQSITLTHLGTLYGTRNFDSLLEALDLLPVSVRGRIRLRNVGGIFLSEGRSYSNHPSVESEAYLPRLQALELAAQSDALVIIQHTDSRSEETIPYKTYDYLNLQIPILALVNNPELEELILSNGGLVADVRSPVDIATKLESLLLRYQAKSRVGSQVPDIQETFRRLVGL